MKTDRTGARAWNRVADGDVVVDGPVDALAVWDGDILLIFGVVDAEHRGEGRGDHGVAEVRLDGIGWRVR
jgi:hypothetical protein